MKLTNRLGLPQALVSAVASDDYDKGASAYSITGLLEPPRIGVLKRTCWDELEEDVSDRIWSLTGRIVHEILERANRTELAECRLFITVDGVSISGKLDTYTLEAPNILSDYKFVTVYKTTGNKLPEEWVAQTNCYAYLLRQNGFPVDAARIVALYRDWSKREARRRPNDYPQQQVGLINIPLWDDDVTLAFIRDRLTKHLTAEKAFKSLGYFPVCTPSERWEKPAKYAVMRKGRKTALQLCDSHGDAEAAAQAVGGYVERRDSEQTRCQYYCAVSEHCDFWREHVDNPRNQLASIMENL